MAQQPETIQGVIKADGTLRIALPRPARNRIYTVQQVSTAAPAVGGSATAGVFLDGNKISSLSARNGTAAGEPYITVRPSSTFDVQYAGAVVGADVAVTFIYDDGVN